MALNIEVIRHALKKERKAYEYYLMAQSTANKARAEWKKTLDHLHALEPQL